MEEEIKDRINMIIHTEVENRCYNIERINEELEEENKKLKTIIESIMKKYNMKEIGMGDEIIMKRYE